MTNQIIPKEVYKFFNTPAYVGEWEGYKVYAEDYGEEAPAIGLPDYVLYKEGEARKSTEDEAFAFLKTLPDED